MTEEPMHQQALAEVDVLRGQVAAYESEFPKALGTIRELISLIERSDILEDWVAALGKPTKNGQPHNTFTKEARRIVNEAKAALAVNEIAVKEPKAI
jgi:hypothetical protein